MKDGASHGRPGSSRDLPPVEALRAGLGLRAGYRLVHDRPAAEASAGRAGNRGRPGRRGAVSGASRLRGWDGLRRRPRPLHAGRGLGLRGTRTRLPRGRLLAGTRPRRGRTHSPSMLRALRRGARESDALRSAGSWLGWRDCLTTLNVGSAPRVIRTPDLLIRSQTLYPTELWARGEERLVLAGVSRVNTNGVGDGATATVRVLSDFRSCTPVAPLGRPVLSAPAVTG